MNFETLFKLGMKRDPGTIQDPTINARWLELGAGNNPVPGAMSLDLPHWNAGVDPIPYKDESVSAIFAFHFFEHLTGENAIKVLRECERVLAPDGLLTTVIPHRLGMIAYQDLDHKSFWCEETWQKLFGNPYYDKHGGWRFKINFNLIAGIVERNLCLFTQLQKTE